MLSATSAFICVHSKLGERKPRNKSLSRENLKANIMPKMPERWIRELEMETNRTLGQLIHDTEDQVK